MATSTKPSFVYVEETATTKDLECHICLEPVYEPVIHPDCQVMYCKFCISKLQKCPTCNKEMNISKLAPVPNYIIKLVDNLKVKCPVCSSPIERRLLQEHIQTCPIPCKACGEKVAPINQVNHDQTICQNYTVDCLAKDQFCTWRGLRSGFQAHILTCPYALMSPVIQVVKNHFQSLLKEQEEYFLQQIQQQKNEMAKIKEELLQNINLSAHGKKWKLSMSSKFFALQNTHESLVDDDHCTTGAATENKSNEWIQATFDFPVLVSSVTLSGLKGAMLAWRSDYCDGKVLQYSHDNNTWIDAHNITSVAQGKPTKFTLKQPVIAKYWRLHGSGYCATATFIFE